MNDQYPHTLSALVDELSAIFDKVSRDLEEFLYLICHSDVMDDLIVSRSVCTYDSISVTDGRIRSRQRRREELVTSNGVFVQEYCRNLATSRVRPDLVDPSHESRDGLIYYSRFGLWACNQPRT